ncbi:hypothetical protein LNQ82_02890 [Conchiformibius steedae DSM 2580]|uniref:Uncharacterized protein n=1 Tax=Conchiformibius steedae DSM 2580 TaxID=1121352 RepID=A0AAE9HTX6_9NEIS|nr:hypothetical protein [Conchiformibius steedae]QMT33471.1 hypothetical protein H3L98_10415 [Conchiformibius steedae]URD68127.1 hypothetical protein LNQ82_02890 [Conchiformibius steedae DSM 2580]
MKHTLYAALAAAVAKFKHAFTELPQPQAVRQPTFYGKAHRFSGVAAARRAAKKRRARRR